MTIGPDIDRQENSKTTRYFQQGYISQKRKHDSHIVLTADVGPVTNITVFYCYYPSVMTFCFVPTYLGTCLSYTSSG